MTLQVFHILLALADQDRHGYGIIREVARQTHDDVSLGTGTLYTALGRLEDAGWIEASPERPATGDDDERRKYYRLTDAGRAAMGAESRRLDAAVGIARRKRVIHGRPVRARRS
jgi:DNA-binding PadR family transcriptional regulator